MSEKAANQTGRRLSASAAFVCIFTGSIARDRGERWVISPPLRRVPRPQSKRFRQPVTPFRNHRREDRGPFGWVGRSVGACRRVIASRRDRSAADGNGLWLGGRRLIREGSPQNLSGEGQAALRSVDCALT